MMLVSCEEQVFVFASALTQRSEQAACAGYLVKYVGAEKSRGAVMITYHLPSLILMFNAAQPLAV